MDAIGIAPQDVLAVWPRIEKYIADACEYNGSRNDAANYQRALIASEKQLWLAMESDEVYGIVITEIIQFPLKKCASVDICTGREFHRWDYMMPYIEAKMKEHGCGQVLLVARPGMSKLLRVNAYKKTHEIYEKEL